MVIVDPNVLRWEERSLGLKGEIFGVGIHSVTGD